MQFVESPVHIACFPPELVNGVVVLSLLVDIEGHSANEYILEFVQRHDGVVVQQNSARDPPGYHVIAEFVESRFFRLQSETVHARRHVSHEYSFVAHLNSVDRGR